MADKPARLFVCIHNAGRSQMAARIPQLLRWFDPAVRDDLGGRVESSIAGCQGKGSA
jgi:protein-tyrosine-phosphatase